MMKTHFKLAGCLILVALFWGCAAQQTQMMSQSMFEPYDFPAAQYNSKVDQFLVILDASSTMGEIYGNQSKIRIARDFLIAMNQTIPEIDVNSALRTFGHHQDLSKKLTERRYGITAYSKPDFENAVKAITLTGGTSPLEKAIAAGSDDLSEAAGKIAVIILSDAGGMDQAPVAAAKDMKARFGDRLCIYTVLVGNDPDGERVLQEIADAGQCGFAARAENLTAGSDMADFVEKVFLTQQLDTDGDGIIDDMDDCPGTPEGLVVDQTGCPIDSDGDGVLDYLDQCPDTPPGLMVDDEGCPFDSDGDGVLDYQDSCPNTPAGVSVDDEGCPFDSDGDSVYDYQDQCYGTPVGAQVNAMGCWVLAGLNFDSGKSAIKAGMHPILNEVVDIMRQNRQVTIEIQGHTDSMGSKVFNQKLSEKRANSVMQYLMENGVEASRMSAKGYGLDHPIASNMTAEGRAKNRRVELEPSQ